MDECYLNKYPHNDERGRGVGGRGGGGGGGREETPNIFKHDNTFLVKNNPLN